MREVEELEKMTKEFIKDMDTHPPVITSPATGTHTHTLSTLVTPPPTFKMLLSLQTWFFFIYIDVLVHHILASQTSIWFAFKHCDNGVGWCQTSPTLCLTSFRYLSVWRCLTCLCLSVFLYYLCLNISSSCVPHLELSGWVSVMIALFLIPQVVILFIYNPLSCNKRDVLVSR